MTIFGIAPGSGATGGILLRFVKDGVKTALFTVEGV